MGSVNALPTAVFLHRRGLVASDLCSHRGKAMEMSLLRNAETTVATGLWWLWRYRNQEIFNANEAWTPMKAGFGCALRDHLGHWVKGSSGLLPPWSVRMYEIFALWRGLVLFWECGIKVLICETNSKDAFFAGQSGGLVHEDKDGDLITKIIELFQLELEDPI
ncbi:hypothetical protein PIB30_085660 [Stylosanthes scabra]|uniref:RNase H type-1 domain-containing protein n=1 Tax=Stylosanthes scabra TaxID=79078 RepID=A0ABU6TSD1_9FABA|nr:hypothetical protein [Stylosanthes scabra]